MPRILNAEPARFNPAAAAVLRALGNYDEIDCDRDRLLREVADAAVLIVRLRNRIDREMLMAAPMLRIVATATTGLTHIDLDEAARRDVCIVCLRGESKFLSTITPTAELTWSLVLALLRRLPEALAHVHAEGWDRDGFIGREAAGRTLGILGYGRLGRIVAQYGLAFRMRVLAHDQQAIAPHPGVHAVDLDALLAESDVLSVHLSYDPSNRHFLGREELRRVKPGAVLVNTARGELVDEAALLEALASGHLAGAALDVLDREGGPDGQWLADRPLWRYANEHDNLLLTPHIGGACLDAMHRTELFLARKVEVAMREMTLAGLGQS